MYVANAHTLVTSQPMLVGLKLIGPCSRDKYVHVYVCMYVCMYVQVLMPSYRDL